MFLMLLYFSSLFVNHVLGSNNEVNIEACKQAVTLGYGYKVMYHIREAGEHGDSHLLFKFYVKTHSDAHILLSTTDNPTESDLGYEVVIGGGRNTFTAIRIKGRQLSGSHASTPNILSGNEFRGFWIKISLHGRLEVGKIGNEAPFIFWDDPHPIIIRYFAFCNWATFIGQWAYSCPNDTQADEVSGYLTTLEKLRNFLLTHYDPYNRPVIQANDVTKVYLQLQNKAVKIDEKQSKMTVTADVHMQWQDQKIQWDPTQYENISILKMAYELWQPELMLYNAAGFGHGFLTGGPMSVTPVGSVKWKAHLQLEVHCKLDLSEWPYDTQVCELQFGFWSDNKYLKLLKGNESAENLQQTNSEWEILNLYYENVQIKTPWIDTDLPKDIAMVIRYELRRSNYMYKAVFGVPLLAISIMTLLPFWISPLHPNKLHISCLSLTVMSIFVISLSRTLPAPADHVPGLVLTYSRGMIAVTFSILISVVIISIARSDHERPVPQIIQNLLKGKYVQFILILTAISNKDASDYGNLLEAENTDEQQGESSNAIHTTNSIQQEWILLAQLIDRIAFIIYAIYLSTVFLGQM